jgi:acyl dehydratase
MVIDTSGIGAQTDRYTTMWTARDSILYALAVGAGGTDPVGAELAFTTDDSAGIAQRALPTLGVVLAGTEPQGWSVLGDIDPASFVHAGHELVCHREIPPAGETEVVGWIEAVWDKGRSALAEYRTRATLVGESEPLFTATGRVMIVGAGGFGGDRGPSAAATALPDRAPDRVVTYQTRPEQALLYRLTGDRARHNSDPVAAAEAGFERPILHGLCTFGFAGRALLHTVCDSDPARFGSMECRFASPVFPGDDLTTRIWELEVGWAFGVTAGDGRMVIDGGRFARRE